MDARIGADSHLCGGGASIPKHHGKKKILEWDLNDWHWDGDQFTAKQTNASTSDCRNKQLFQFPADGEQYNSTDAHIDTLGRGNGESEKRRRVIVVEDGGLPDGDAFLNLKLGKHVYPVADADITNLEGKNAEMGKLQLGSSNRGACQVEGCGADLSSSKEYHRRHKVCEVHAKSSSALVNNVFQRFCQQCSRFHLLKEFDEGKRSCRRRLAGHNRRRRKTHPDATANGMPTIDEQASSYLLISLIRILSNLQSDNSKDQDLLSNLIRSLGGLAGSVATRNLPGPLQTPQDNEEVGTCAENSSKSANGNGLNTQQFHESLPSTNTACVPVSPGAHRRPTGTSATIAVALKGTSFGNERKVSPANRTGLRDFDLNDAYNCTPNCRGSERLAPAECLEDGPPICRPGMLPNSCQSTYALFSDSTSTQLRSSSNGDAQNKTGRIVFKLFGKEPNDFPILLREQILDWLSHSPTDIESYIRPGCVILTIYVRQAESAWDELCHDLSSSLNRLLCNSGDSFWRSGWFYARVKHHIAFIYSGHVLDTPRILKSAEYCNITCVTPIAAVISSKVEFRVKAVNLTNSTRLICAFEGKYLVQEPVQSLVRATTACKGSQCLSLICLVPNATGRGFIEIEDHGLSGGFFPFIVAEEELCSEIRMLENAIDVTSYDVKFEQRTGNMTDRNQALEFLNEMGWLLRRSTQKGRSRELTGIPNGLFSLSRFRWLVAFSMDYQWCAVIKKLLDLLFDRIIDLGGIPPDKAVLSEELLHKAVRKNSRSMVEFLLAYKPRRATKLTCESNLFRADMNGPSKITPLHVAATMTEAESILDALTNDPAMLGIKAWSNSHDDTGFTPEDYARARGHLSYINLVNKKANRQLHKSPIVLHIPGSLLAATEATNKHSVVENSGKTVTTFAMEKSRLGSLKPILPPYCRLCSRRAHSSTISRSPVYRPLMLSMVGIAVVCVCVGLLLKGPPEVLFVFPPFTWESLDYGFI